MPPWDWWVPLAWAVLLVTSVRAATISFGNGLGQRARGWSEVSFSVTEAGTTVLCDLSFETDLSSISSALVSCKTLYDAVGAEVVIGETSYSWTFYANIGGSVHDVGATLLFNPTTSTLSSLILCFQAVCTNTAQDCLAFPQSSSSYSSFSSQAVANPSFSVSYSTNSSNPEGFVFVLSSNPSFSSPLTTASTNPSSITSAFPSESVAGPTSFEQSSLSVSVNSSAPEGFVFVLSSNPSFSSSLLAATNPSSADPSSIPNSPSSSLSIVGPQTSCSLFIPNNQASSCSYPLSSLTMAEGSSSVSARSSAPEGFVFNFGSTPTESSSSGEASQLTAPTMESSSVSTSSSAPEGFVFNFGSTASSSSTNGATETTTEEAANTTTTIGTTALTEVQAGTTASTSTII